jgi:hypothetical protein
MPLADLGAHVLWDDLFAINGYIAGRFNADTDLIPVNLDDRDHDIVANHDLLTQLPAKNQHDYLPVDLSNSFELVAFRFPLSDAYLKNAHLVPRI